MLAAQVMLCKWMGVWWWEEGGGGKVCGMLTVGYEYTRPVLGHMAVWLVDSTVQCQWTQGGLYGVVLATGWLSWVPCIIVQIYTVHSIT